MKPLVVILLCAFISVVNAQTIESRIEELGLANSNDRERASELIRELDSRWAEFDNTELKSSYLLKKIYFYLLNSNSEQAKKYIHQVLSYKDVAPYQKVVALNYLSQIEMELENYNSSFKAIYKSIELLHLVKSNIVKFNFHHSSANIFIETGFLEQALSHAQQALEIAQNNNLGNESCYAESLKFSILNKLNDSAIKSNDFKKTIERCASLDLNLLQANLYKNLGIYQAKNSNIDMAKESFMKALDLLEITPYLPEKNDAELGLAEIYTKELDVTASATLIDNVIYESSNLKSLKDAYTLSAKNNELSGNIVKESLALKKVISINEKIQTDKLSKNLAFQQVRFAHLNQEMQLKILDQENKLLKLNSAVEQQSKKIYQLFSIVAILLVVLAVMMFLRVRKQKEMYQELSRVDGLTGVLSRRYVLNIANEIHNRSNDQDYEYSLVVFDLDYFKSINDKYGHAIGDWVLKQVTQNVSREIREEDAFGRLGGEEFVLVLPNTKSDEARKLAKRCLEAIKTIRHDVFEEGFIVTASFGVATYPDFQDLEALIQNADDAMYKAKQMGRNQIFSFS